MQKLMAEILCSLVCLPGVGFSVVMVAMMVTVYYSAIVAFTLFYIFASFQSPLPWSKCPSNTSSGSVQYR